MQKKVYIAIDLKSFYASVECVDRGLDPLRFNLVVADASRTEKTICLAVSPSLKANGIPGRARLFEVIERVGEVNDERKRKLRGGDFLAPSFDSVELSVNPTLKLDYIVAPPRMRRYMEVSSEVCSVYLQFVAPEDIHVYSVDEVFIDATPYLSLYSCTAEELASRMIKAVLEKTGITATAGIGTNLFLCKVAMDIVAKRKKADKNGVRIASLDEESFKTELWDHEPLTDFWRIGGGYSKRLARMGIHTMGEVARCSLRGKEYYPNREALFKEFGVNARFLIDHAWGRETATISEIKAYRPKTQSLSSGQVLSRPYKTGEARLIVHEMTELLVLDMVKKGVKTDQLTLTIGYDTENARWFEGEIKSDHYGRPIPKHAHGTANLDDFYSSTKLITDAVLELFDRIIDPRLTVRRINVCANRITRESELYLKKKCIQLDFFTDYEAEEKRLEERRKFLEREKKEQDAIIEIRKKFGKNAILKGFNFEEGATTRERNAQVGGHKAG